ncbi:hypothetical protein [Massilia rhizosphaerae]|uniref:hypothetical protein n=1 Tax=Massilia rhizosphaerae TaxID=2784389 RepID=UPI0018DEAD24|nr:hypothetical protein [Massilia rhizosphaerae]
MMACTLYVAANSKKNSLFRQWIVILGTLAVLESASARDEASWPRIPLPKQVDVFEVGREIVVNGTPIRMIGFVSRATPSELAATMRQLLGAPLMEDLRGTTLVLGRGEGPFYITVQLAPLGSGTRALVAVTKPAVSDQGPPDADADRHLLSALPPGSTLISHTSSFDAPARADQAVVMNSHSADINTEYVKRMLRADGYTLEREARPAQASRSQARVPSGARTMFFKRAGSEAIAVIARDGSGDSVIVLNRLNFAEHGK